MKRSNEELNDLIWQKINYKTKPLGSLGRLEELAAKICSIQETLEPELNNPHFFIFASDHGLANEAISAYPQEVTWQMVQNFLQGGAAINVFCQQEKIALTVVDAGVNYDFDMPVSMESGTTFINRKIAKSTKNCLRERAMSQEECTAAIEEGKKLIKDAKDKGCSIIGLGEMGIGNTSSASLILSAISGMAIEQSVGAGTGLSGEGLEKKKAILKNVSQFHGLADYSQQMKDLSDSANLAQSADLALEVLSKVGGFEIAMMVGAMLEAKKEGIIILVDGFIVSSALLIASQIDNSVLDNCIFAHRSKEKAHSDLLAFLGADPLLDMGLRLGEGSGAAIAFPLVKSAVNFMNNMASFESAAVSEAK